MNWVSKTQITKSERPIIVLEISQLQNSYLIMVYDTLAIYSHEQNILVFLVCLIPCEILPMGYFIQSRLFTLGTTGTMPIMKFISIQKRIVIIYVCLSSGLIGKVFVSTWTEIYVRAWSVSTCKLLHTYYL